MHMFRATQCSSSEESIVPIPHLVCITLCRWLSGMLDRHTRQSPKQSDIYQMMYWYNWFSWWWALCCSKHVEKWNKHIKKYVKLVINTNCNFSISHTFVGKPTTLWNYEGPGRSPHTSSKGWKFVQNWQMKSLNCQRKQKEKNIWRTLPDLRQIYILKKAWSSNHHNQKLKHVQRNKITHTKTDREEWALNHRKVWIFLSLHCIRIKERNSLNLSRHASLCEKWNHILRNWNEIYKLKAVQMS